LDQKVNPIDIIKSMCQIDDSGIHILNPDIDINAIMKSAGFRNAFEPKNVEKNLPENIKIEEQ
jgi:hypothetical protein